MKIWGSIAELVSVRFRKNGKQITLTPNGSVTYNADINVLLPPQITGTVLVSADSQQELTNKTFDADGTGNVLSNVEDDNIKAGAAIDRTKLASGSEDHVVINSAAGVLSSEQYLSKTRGGTGITSTATFPASGTVAVTGDKLSVFAATDSSELAGVISDETGSGALVFGTSPSLTTPSISLATLSSYSTTTAAADSTVTPALDLPIIVITSVTSSAINAVANPSNGKQVFLVNNNQGDLIINDNNGGTSGIYTGTGQAFTLKSNASVSLLYSSQLNRWVLSGGAGSSGGGTTIRGNGGTTGYPVGTPVYLSGGTFLPASAAAANTAEVVGLVLAEPISGTYDVILVGQIEVVSATVYDTGVASAAGTVLFLSPTAGKLTAVEPSIIGQVSVPLAVSQGGTGIVVSPKRGVVLGGTNARTQLNLVSAAATQIFDAASPSLYTAGELTGWVQLGTSQKFYFRAPFAQNGGSTDWNISPSYVGDTPPAGFSITMASTGVVTMTCPTFTGTGLVNYALNAPAVGATFPLAVDAGSLTTGTVAAARLPAATSTTAGTLSYYQEDDITLAGVRWNFTTPTSTFNIKLTRIGRCVTMTFPAKYDGTSSGSVGSVLLSVNIPTAFRPNYNSFTPVVVVSSNSSVANCGGIELLTTGEARLFYSTGTGTWPNLANSGCLGLSVTFTI
jgi:hypothetical protein